MFKKLCISLVLLFILLGGFLETRFSQTIFDWPPKIDTQRFALAWLEEGYNKLIARIIISKDGYKWHDALYRDLIYDGGWGRMCSVVGDYSGKKILFMYCNLSSNTDQHGREIEGKIRMLEGEIEETNENIYIIVDNKWDLILKNGHNALSPPAAVITNEGFYIIAVVERDMEWNTPKVRVYRIESDRNIITLIKEMDVTSHIYAGYTGESVGLAMKGDTIIMAYKDCIGYIIYAPIINQIFKIKINDIVVLSKFEKIFVPEHQIIGPSHQIITVPAFWTVQYKGSINCLLDDLDVEPNFINGPIGMATDSNWIYLAVVQRKKGSLVNRVVLYRSLKGFDVLSEGIERYGSIPFIVVGNYYDFNIGIASNQQGMMIAVSTTVSDSKIYSTIVKPECQMEWIYSLLSIQRLSTADNNFSCARLGRICSVLGESNIGGIIQIINGLITIPFIGF